MPFHIIPIVLGTSFVLIWMFIGGMILRDSQREARRRRELHEHLANTHMPRPRRRRSRLATSQ